jgi:hypothetical protein
MGIRVEKGRASGTGGRVGAAFNAFDGSKKVGRLEIRRTPERAQVSWITVNENARRSGVATRLYEAAARFSCEVWGRPLGSDYRGSRAPGAEGFWQKQYRKGRADLVGSKDSPANQFVLRCPAPLDLSGMRRRKRK